MVQWFELDMDAACSSLTHARALQSKFTSQSVAGWIDRHSATVGYFQNMGLLKPTSLVLPATFH